MPVLAFSVFGSPAAIIRKNPGLGKSAKGDGIAGTGFAQSEPETMTNIVVFSEMHRPDAIGGA